MGHEARYWILTMAEATGAFGSLLLLLSRFELHIVQRPGMKPREPDRLSLLKIKIEVYTSLEVEVSVLTICPEFFRFCAFDGTTRTEEQ